MAVKQETIREEIPLAERVLAIEADWRDALEKGEVTNKKFCKLIGNLISLYLKTPKGAISRIFLHDGERVIEIGYFPESGKMRPKSFARVSLPQKKGDIDSRTGISYSRKIVTVKVDGETSTIRAKGHPKESGGWVLWRQKTNPPLIKTLKTIWAAYQSIVKNTEKWVERKRVFK